MFRPLFLLAAALTVALGLAAIERTPSAATEGIVLAGDGVVTVKSAYGMAETVSRLKSDIAAKGIVFFAEIDQSRLAADAGVALSPSTLLIFGNPALGTLFIVAKGEAGLDWPVRLLVREDAAGEVWVHYSDFAWIAERHGIVGRREAFDTAAQVIGSITSSIVR